MNAKIHPLIAALVIAAAVAAAALWAWASGQAASFGGPAELSRGPHGHSYIQVQNFLVEHDTDGNYVRTHDLGELGVELVLGGHAFFSNGDILLRRGVDPRSFLDNFRAYRRETNINSIVPESPDSGLARCNLESMACERFGQPGIDFKAAFGVFIDERTDEVYISDTTRHLLRKYSAAGIELAPPASGFKFPNELMLHDDRLLVADTNHHVIRILEPGSSDFGTRVDSRDVVPASARSAGHRWPSHFARVGDTWWVNNMQTGMNLGGLYVFDDDWQFIRRVELPAGADPISILAVAGTVWVSDWNNDVVRRFAVDGEPLSDLQSDGLDTVLSRFAEERRRYTVLSFAGVIVVGLMFVGLIVQAFARSMNAATVRRAPEADRQTAASDSGPLHLEPDEAARKRVNGAARLVVILSLLTVIPLGILLGLSDKPELIVKLLGPLSGLLAIVVLIVWVNRGNWGSAITLDGTTLTLRDYTGRVSSCPVRDVRYDNTAIATRDAVVILGRPQNRIYREADVKDELLPRLADARRVGALDMLKIQVELRHPQGLVSVIAIVAVLFYAVFYFAT